MGFARARSNRVGVVDIDFFFSSPFWNMNFLEQRPNSNKTEWQDGQTTTAQIETDTEAL